MIEKSNHSLLRELDHYRKAQEVHETMAAGVHEAQEESRRLGVPNVYFINGFTYYELPDGSLSLNDPYVEPKKDAK